MGYQFKGFFAEHSEGLVESAAEQWPYAQIKVLHTPFSGVALRLPDAMTSEEMEMLHLFEKELPVWTNNFPYTTFVYVYADCFGGVCDYSGYVCKAGIKLSVEAGDGALSRLLNHLGVDLNHNKYFEPFTRSYQW